MNGLLSAVFTLFLLVGCGLTPQVQSKASEASVGGASVNSAEKRSQSVEAAIVLKASTVHGNPQTEVMLELSGAIERVTGVTTVKAPCAQKSAQADELLRIECWWAGAGQTLVVKTVKDALLITKQESEEHGTTKPLKVLKRVSLKPGQRVSAKRP